MNPNASEEQRQRIEDFQRTNQLGLATLFFSDLVGSVQLKQSLGDRAAIGLIQAHHAAFRELLAQFPKAEEIDTAGDSFFLIFATPSDAVRFALLAQARTHALATASGCALRDRIGIHVGEVFIKAAESGGKPKDLFGTQVDTCARIMSLGESDQILLSRFAFDSARQALRGDALDGTGELAWLNHGFYEIKGVGEPVEICEVGEVGRACLKAPEAGEKGHRIVTGDEPVLGWRPAAGQLVPNTQWVLDRLLGEGGFGEVWLARHQTLKDRRVFKFCFNAEKARSLKREVTLFRVLREHVGTHPGIVAVHDVYFDQPPYYIVMDHIDGPTLNGWAEAHAPLDAVPLGTRLEIVAQIADALQTAHDAGVIHRDVKPSNILIAEENGATRAMLTDFGIGQLVSGETPAGITQLGFTQTMMSPDSMRGTQLYLAPELLSGQPATIRSDIYALGIVLYQLTVGALNRPLTSDWADDVADPLLREDIRACVAGDPAKRFAGGAQLASHLRELPARRAALEREKLRIKLLELRAYRRGVLRAGGIAAVVVTIIVALTLYGFEQARRAQRSAREETRQREEAQRQAGAAHAATERAAHARAEAEKLIEFMSLDLKRKLETVGRLDLLEETARAVEKYYESGEETASGAGLFRHGLARENRAEVEIGQGRLEPAIRAVSDASDYYRRASEAAPEELRYSLAVARSSARLARFFQMKGEAEAAVTHADRGFALITAMPASFIGSEAHGVACADTLASIGKIFAAHDREERAGGCFAKASAWLDDYVRQFPANIEGRVALARSLAANASNSPEAECRARTAQAREIARSLLENEPENRLFRRLSGEIDLTYGPRLNWMGHDAEGLEALESALKIFEQLHREDPRNLDLAVTLFETHYQTGYLKIRGNKFDALPNFNAMTAIAEVGVKSAPDDRFWRARLGDCFHRLGEYWGRKKDLAKAIDYETKAVAMHESSMDPGSPTPEDLARLAYSYRYLAMWSSQVHPDAALEAANKAVELDELSHAGKDGTRASGWIRRERASILRRIGRRAEAEADLRKAVEYFIAARPPHFVLGSEREVAMALDFHAGNLTDLSRFDEADARYAEELAVLEKMLAEGGAETGTQKSVAHAWKERANLALRKGDKAAFRERLKLGVKAWEAALAHDPANAQNKTEFNKFLNECVQKAARSGDTELAAELRAHLPPPLNSPPN